MSTLSSPVKSRAKDRGLVKKHSYGQSINNIILLLFVITCVFDPADKIFGFKVELFVICWICVFFTSLWSRDSFGIPSKLLIYVGLFIFIPFMSIVWYIMISGKEPFEGGDMIKGYILITLAPMLVIARVNLIPILCGVLTCLAILIISTYITIQLLPDTFSFLYLIGPETGLLFMDKREYSPDFALTQVYFVTSPMLAIAIAYYFSRVGLVINDKERVLLMSLVIINVTGIILAGTRNNILTGAALPLLLSLLYIRNKLIAIALITAVVFFIPVVFYDRLIDFFNPNEISNSVKLSLISDYLREFSDPLTFFLGQGLGAYFSVTNRGYLHVTELTYLEVFRNFGVFGGSVMIGLLIAPLFNVLAKKANRQDSFLAVGYFAYLIMCISNPNLFSSMGTLILGSILANTFAVRTNRDSKFNLPHEELGFIGWNSKFAR